MTTSKEDKEKLQSEEILQQKASMARKKLMTKSLLFFGINLYKYRWLVDMGCPDMAGAYVRFNKDDLASVEAGGIFLNGKLVRKPEFSHLNLTWFLLHELLHILNGHGLRMGQKDQMTWNFATDHVIESFLKTIYDEENAKNVKNVITPPGGIQKANIIDDIVKDIPEATAEEAYDWLVKRRKQFKYTPIAGSGAGGKGNGNGDSKFFEVEDTKTGKKYIVSNPQYSPKDKKAAKRAQAEARAAFAHFKQRGDIPAGIASYLDKILKVEIPWQELLEKAIKQTAIMKPSGRSWRSINKFFAPHGITLPGVEYEEENEGVGTLIVGVDTSGSISEKEKQEFAGIIMDSVKYFKKIRIVVHDVSVHQDLEYDKDTILEFGRMLKDTGFKGGGGTSHQYLFEEIEKMYDEDPDEISMFISLTDGYSDVESVWNSYRWSKRNYIPTYFVITQSGREIEKPTGAEFNHIMVNNTSEMEEAA